MRDLVARCFFVITAIQATHSKQQQRNPKLRTISTTPAMKPTVFSLLLLALLGMVCAAPFRSRVPALVRMNEMNEMNDVKHKDELTEEDTPFCRLYQGVSKCVGKPLDVKDKEPWCPYRMCGPSLVPAALCPKNREFQATNKCSVKLVEKTVYRCDGNSFGSTYLPLHCVKGSEGCEEVNTCSCIEVNVKTAVLTEEAVFKPHCPESTQ